ncbi:MAG TPA: ABC transporter ATP-binding protein [Candidatus Binataceae bacterium]|nr:ABC transporter ATP-binding protein [Candidatus Binataceae bacterium]
MRKKSRRKSAQPASPRAVRAPRTPAAIVDVANLRIERDAVILRSVDWTIAPGEHWVILGANGSGKTSLLSALTGYLPPTSGVITVLGETYGLTDWRELRKRIGLCSSSIRQLMEGHQTALETVISGRHAMIGMWGEVRPEERTQALRILRQVEATVIRDRPWRFLSQGERQRALIGRALMARPELLILDEPCAGLDPVAREHFLQFLERLARKRGAPTMVLVTHHVEEIMPVFSHVLVLKEGSVLAAGAKIKVLTSHTLSRAFHAPVRLRRQRGRYSLAVSATLDAVL